MLKIEFSRSRSKQFPEVLNLAKSFSGFKESDGNYSVEFSERDLFGSWDLFAQFHNQVIKWSGCNVYFQGVIIKPYRTLLFYSLQSVILCAKHQNQHNCKLPNGLPGWGCSNLRKISRHLDNYVYCYWYNFGHFSDDMRIWIVDKDILYDKLIGQANESYLTACPHFDKSLLKQIVNSLPGSVEIDNINFQISYRKDFVGTRIMNIPSGIVHVERSDPELSDFPFVDEKEKSIDEMTEEEINRLIEEKRSKLNNS